MTLNRWDPFKDLLRFQERMNRLMDLSVGEASRGPREHWTPGVDTLETPDAYIFRIDLPGVGKEEISIEIRGRHLVIKGERKMESEPRIAAYHSIERQMGAFERSFMLPGDVNADEAEARYLDGVLQLSLPKSREEKACPVSVVCQG